jgi:HEAT repeat protein
MGEDYSHARRALRAIDEVGPEVLPILLEIVEDGNRRTRPFAFHYLQKLGPLAKDAIPKLRELRDDAEYERYREELDETPLMRREAAATLKQW